MQRITGIENHGGNAGRSSQSSHSSPLHGLQQAGLATRRALQQAAREKTRSGRRASQILGSAMRTKSTLIQSVQSIIEDDSLDFASLSSMSSPRRAPPQSMVRSLQQHTERYKDDLYTASSRPPENKTNDSQLGRRCAAEKMPGTRTPHSSIISPSDALRLSRRFQCSPLEEEDDYGLNRKWEVLDEERRANTVNIEEQYENATDPSCFGGTAGDLKEHGKPAIL